MGIIDKSVKATVKTGQGMMDAGKTMAERSTRFAGNMIVNYTPDIYDRHDDLSTGAARFAVGNTYMMTRTGYRGVRTLNGVRRKTISRYVLNKKVQIQNRFTKSDLKKEARLRKLEYKTKKLNIKASSNFQKGIHWKQSSMMMIKNQSRKLSNTAIYADDSYENRATGLAMKASPYVTSAGYKFTKGSLKTGWKVARFSWKNRHHLVRSTWVKMVSAVKNIAAAVVSIVSSATGAIVALVTALPVLALVLAVIAILSIFSSTPEMVCGSGTDIKPCDLDNSIKDIAWANQNWNSTSDQWDLFNCKNGGCSPATSPKEGKNEYGELKLDELGFYYIEDAGVKYYCNAMASYYTSKVGDRFRITTSEGNSYNIIICDQKADMHTHAGNNDSNGHCLSGTGGMLEFYVDKHSFVGGSLDQNFDEEHPFKGSVEKVQKLGVNGACQVGGILEAEGVKIDFSSKYYTYNSNGVDGNPCVCDLSNTTAWPFNNCYPPTSITGGFNKMICSSYAAGRYWEVNYPNDNFPLPRNWDDILTNGKRAPGGGQFSRDVNNPIPKSIVSITYGRMQHVAFIEGVGDDGSVLISECNATTENEYGFRVRKFDNLQAFLNSYGATLNGMYGK